MQKVYKLTTNSSSTTLSNEEKFSGITMIGHPFIDNTDECPKNPKGEDLILLLTIDTSILNQYLQDFQLPENKYISIFSTYSPQRYFLDDLVFCGDLVELNHLKKGYTRVTISDRPTTDFKFPLSNFHELKIEEKDLDPNDFPALSFISNQIPRGLSGCQILQEDYYFVGQFYSMDLPPYDGSALYLSDAVGYLFLRKSTSNPNDAGFFFVQTG